MFGPIKSNTSFEVCAVAKLLWGNFKSAETTINDHSSRGTLVLDINPDTNVLNQLKQAVADYNKILTAVLKKQDSSYLDSSEVINQKFNDEFKDMSSKGIYFSGHYLYSNITPESVTINASSDNVSGNLYTYSAIIASTDYYTQDYGEPGSSVFCTSENGIQHEYNAVYDSEKKTWSIVNIGLDDTK